MPFVRRFSSKGSPLKFLPSALLRQFGNPSGVLGKIVAPALNRGNASHNLIAVKTLGEQLTSRQQSGHLQLLDVGFGGAVAIPNLLRLVGSGGQVTAIDISSDMIERANRRFNEQIRSGNLELIEGAIESAGINPASMDGAIAVNVIYFWPDLYKGFLAISEALKVGAPLVVGVRPAWFLKKVGFKEMGFNVLTPEQVEAKMQKAGFMQTRLLGSGKDLLIVGKRA